MTHLGNIDAEWTAMGPSVADASCPQLRGPTAQGTCQLWC